MSVFDKAEGSRRQDGRSMRLISATLWHLTRRRAGEVLDSRCGRVHWSADDEEQAFDIINPGLPHTRVTFRLRAVTATIGALSVELKVGPRGIRRSTYWVAAEVRGVDYRVRQRGRRRGEIERAGQPIAVLSRPRRSPRSVDWATAVVTSEEIALGHALTVCAEIGAPGAVANVMSFLPI